MDALTRAGTECVNGCGHDRTNSVKAAVTKPVEGGAGLTAGARMGTHGLVRIGKHDDGSEWQRRTLGDG